MATEFSREFFADNRIVKAELRSARKPREEELNRDPRRGPQAV